MDHAFLFVPLLTFVASLKGDPPRVKDVNFPQRTTPSGQTSLLPCTIAHRQVPDRAAPAPTLGDISCVQPILRGNRHPSLDLPIDRRM